MLQYIHHTYCTDRVEHLMHLWQIIRAIVLLLFLEFALV